MRVRVCMCVCEFERECRVPVRAHVCIAWFQYGCL